MYVVCGGNLVFSLYIYHKVMRRALLNLGRCAELHVQDVNKIFSR